MKIIIKIQDDDGNFYSEERKVSKEEISSAVIGKGGILNIYLSEMKDKIIQNVLKKDNKSKDTEAY